VPRAHGGAKFINRPPAARAVADAAVRPVLRSARYEPDDMSVAREGRPLPRYRRSHPYRAFAWMVVPMLAAPLVIFLPFLGWVLLLVLLPIEFGRIGGRRIARSDALWVAVPASALVSLYEIAIMVTVLDMAPGFPVRFDLLGTLIALIIFAFNGFFYSVGALSTSFNPSEPVASDGRPAPSP
jgi:hypothetical protein